MEERAVGEGDQKGIEEGITCCENNGIVPKGYIRKAEILILVVMHKTERAQLVAQIPG